MKKFSWILVSILLVSMMVFFSTNVGATSITSSKVWYFRGDVNKDLKVDGIDAWLINQQILLRMPKTLEADANGDGKIDSKDITQMYRYLRGQDIIPGDVDGNLKLNSNDVIYLEKYLLGFKGYKKTKGMDANSDGRINMGDATVIEKMILNAGK